MVFTLLLISISDLAVLPCLNRPGCMKPIIELTVLAISSALAAFWALPNIPSLTPAQELIKEAGFNALVNRVNNWPGLTVEVTALLLTLGSWAVTQVQKNTTSEAPASI